MPLPTIPTAQVLPSLEWIYVPPLTPTGANAFGAVTAIAPGATIQINSGPDITLTDPAWCFFLEGFIYPLCPAHISMHLDDNDPSCTSSGTWTEKVPTGTVGGQFCAWDVRNGQFHQATD